MSGRRLILAVAAGVIVLGGGVTGAVVAFGGHDHGSTQGTPGGPASARVDHTGIPENSSAWDPK